MNFGFCYVGLAYMFLLFIPNIIWAKNKPQGYEKYAANENKVLAFLERTGEIFVTCFSLIFTDFNLRPFTPWSLWLAASFLLMVFYEIYWFRFFKSSRTMLDQYRSFLCFPVAGASLPVLAFFLLAAYGKNIPLTIAVIVLGIGHIGIHLAHAEEAKSEAKAGTECSE